MGNNSGFHIVDFVKYRSVTKFLKDISYDGVLYKLFSSRDFVFRGHSSNKYKLLPSALRTESKELFDRMALCSIDESEYNLEFHQIVKELYLLRNFYKRCDNNGLFVDNVDFFRKRYFDNLLLGEMKRLDRWIPEEMWTVASQAQHYGLFTRLLDWTYDIHTALYFCVEDYLEGRKLPEGTTNIDLWALNTKMVAELDINKVPLKMVRPIYNGNENLYAQHGLFTLWQVGKIDYQSPINRTPLDELIIQKINNNSDPLPLLLRIMLPANSAKQIYNHIVNLGYDASRLYPGYNGVARSLKHDFYLYKERLLAEKVLIAKR